MNVSARTEYACTAVMELGLRRGGAPVRIRAIAEAHGIPSQFLVQILLQLKNAGLVRSTRGASGGYQLAKAPQEITLADIVEVVEGPLEGGDKTASSDTAVTQVVRQAWQSVGKVLRDQLESITIAQMIEDVGSPEENMYYI